MRTYRYGIAGVSDPQSVAEVVAAKKGVLSVDANATDITYTLDDGADEYEIMVAAFDACEKLGGTLIVSENNETTAGADEYENEFGAAAEKTPDNRLIDGHTGIKENKIRELGFEEDGIVAGKKRLKADSITRLAELSVAVIFAVVSIFIKDASASTFSFKNIILVVAFALAAYETLYAALTDLIAKKWLSENVYVSVAFVCGALLGEITATAFVAIAYAAGRALLGFVKDRDALKTEETFFTGSFSVETDDGKRKAIKDIAEGDVLTLYKYDVVPCDGTVFSAAKFDCHKTGESAEKLLQSGEFVCAGSLLLDESVKIRVDNTNENSRIKVERKAFDEVYKKACTPHSRLALVTPCAFGAALVFALVFSAFYRSGYGAGLLVYGRIGLLIVFLSTVFGLIASVKECVGSALVTARSELISFADEKAFIELGRANSFRFDALALTEDGALKGDALGALKELYNCGVGNVTTDFSGSDLDSSVADKIDFVDKAFKGERTVTVGDGKFLSLCGDGSVKVGNGEISFVPLSYKLAVRAVRAKTAATVLSCALYAASVVLAVFLPQASVLFAALPALVATFCSSALALLSSRRKV